MKAGALFRRVVLFVAIAAGTAPASDPTYQIKGKILQPDGKSFGRWAIVFLSSATTPFATRAIGDTGGSFGFKNLSAGTYNLTVAIPRVGEITKTIEVSPNFADAKRVVRTTLVFDRSTVSSKPLHKVSAAALAIPDNANREYNRAMECLERKDVDGAIEKLRRALKIAPRFPAALNALGTISYQLKQYPAAEEYFRNALQIDPEAYEPLVNLAGTLLSLERCGDALSWNLRAVNARPNDPLAQSQLGRNYFCLGQYEHAETHLKQAKALDASHFSFPQLVLARVYREFKNWPAAVNELEEFLKLHPDSKFAGYARQDLADVRTRLP
jgi:tetratricopeptide (TPR) repeat protein